MNVRFAFCNLPQPGRKAFERGEQKEIIDNFKPKKRSLTRLLINGHFGSGKTVLLTLGMRKLFDEIPSSKEKHVIIFTSLGFIQSSDGHIYNSALPNYKKQFTLSLMDR